MVINTVLLLRALLVLFLDDFGKTARANFLGVFSRTPEASSKHAYKSTYCRPIGDSSCGTNKFRIHAPQCGLSKPADSCVDRKRAATEETTLLCTPSIVGRVGSRSLRHLFLNSPGIIHAKPPQVLVFAHPRPFSHGVFDTSYLSNQYTPGSNVRTI